jgi:molybdenum cofactor cytidylyltransferase
MINAIILAAGESKRMGLPKMLLPFGEKTMIEAVISHAVSSKISRIHVITGANREKIEEVIKKYPVKIVYNARYTSGMLSSVQSGFRSLPEDTDGVLILLGDQPSVSNVIIDEVIESSKKTKKGIVLPVYRGHRGHPVLIDAKYTKEVKRLDPDIGLRSLLHAHPEDVYELPLNSRAILQDIDNPEDYKKEISKL